MIQKQARQIELLQEALAQAQVEHLQTQENVENTVTALEAYNPPRHSKINWGGYGELHYEGGPVDEIDFHRFVLFAGYDFNERLRFISELEVEHGLAGDGFNGAVELEQAYLEYDLRSNLRLRAGLQLLPIGLLNETHEPTTFYGVERNRIENQIIPTTYWEAAIGVNGQAGKTGLSYDLLFHSGLELTAVNEYQVRSGRRRASEAPAHSGALTGRLKYTGLPGIELAASLSHHFDVTQGQGDELNGQKVPATLFEAHMAARYKGFGLRTLYGVWDIRGQQARALGRDRAYGFFVEPSYRFDLPVLWPLFPESMLGLFYRYETYNTRAGLSVFPADRRHVVGVNFWPIPNIVLKGDYLFHTNALEQNIRGLNLGIGYQF